MLDLAVLGAAKFANGVSLWQVNVPVANDNDKVESFGEIDVIQSLGVSSTPYPKDESGFAQCLVARGIVGLDGICIGGRDLRNTGFLGKQSPGDVTLHATGPGAVAQCFVKNTKRQAGLATEDSSGESMILALDGKNNKFHLAARGAVQEIDKDGNWSYINSSGYGISVDESGVHFHGPVFFKGIKPGFAIMVGPQTGSPGGSAALPLVALTGVGGDG